MAQFVKACPLSWSPPKPKPLSNANSAACDHQTPRSHRSRDSSRRSPTKAEVASGGATEAAWPLNPASTINNLPSTAPRGLRPRQTDFFQRSEGCGVKDGRPAWRAHCPAEREGWISSERVRRARLSGHKALLSSVDRAAEGCEPHLPACVAPAAGWLAMRRRGPVCRGFPRSAGYGNGAALRITALVSGSRKQGKTPGAQARAP